MLYDRIRYLISLKSGITYIFCHYFAKIKVDSCDSLTIEKIFTLLYINFKVIIFIKSFLSKDKNHHYHKIFLKMYQLAEK